MRRAGAGRRVRGIALAVATVVVLFAGAYWLVRPRMEVAEGLVPDPVSPFGPVTRAEVVFRWAVPADGAPVRIEILDSTAKAPPIWASEPVATGSLRPDAGAVERWPLEDLLWRPVAVPSPGTAREGPLAAFTLLP